MTTAVTPTLPFLKVTSDATVSAVQVLSGGNSGDSNNVNIQYMHVAVDTANVIFVQLPNRYVNNQVQYQWYALDTTALNYPIGTINDINCSFTFNGLSCIIHLIVLANDNVYQFTGLSAQPGVGVTTYGWLIITPTGPQPILPNPR